MVASIQAIDDNWSLISVASFFRVRIAITSVVILTVAILWRYQESDNVRFVMDSVTGQFTMIRERLASLVCPLVNFVREIYQRD